MKRRDSLEWFSLTPPDFPGWLALGAVAGMYFSNNEVIDRVLLFAAIGLAFTACILGIGANRHVSQINNVLKKWTYPFFVVLILIGIVFHYAIWEPVMQPPRAEPIRQTKGPEAPPPVEKTNVDMGDDVPMF